MFPLSRTNKYIQKHFILLSLSAIIITGLFSCNPVKYVPENKQLLDKTKIEVESGKIDNKDLKSYLKQKPNKRVLGTRFHLGLYNLSSKKKDNGFNRWLQNIGEEPVIFDQLLTDKTSRQFKLYLSKKGYFLNEVTAEVIPKKKKKVWVIYHVVPNTPFAINNIYYNIEDTGLQYLIFADTSHCLIKRDKNFDEDILLAERNRIERLLRDRGYYNFSKEYIYYEADSSNTNRSVDIVIGVKKYLAIEDNKTIETPHKTYKIGNITIYTDKIINAPDSSYHAYDTIYLDEKTFYYPREKRRRIKPITIDQCIFVNKGKLYKVSDVEKTYKHLLSLKVYKNVDITFEQSSDTIINCIAQLSQLDIQSYTIEIEGTNSAGNIGAAGNLIYHHKNLFNGAESFNIKLTGATEAIQETKENDDNTETRTIENTLELGAEVSLLIPRFLLPIKTEGFVKKFNPKTNISTAYNYHRRPEYTRTIANASFGYSWRGNRFTTHIVNPIELNAVNIIAMKQSFYDSLPPILRHSYEDHFVATSTYSFIYTNQNINKNTDFYYIRVNLESAGNLFSLYNRTFSSDTIGSYRTLGLVYSQFVKGDIDFRYSHALNQTDKIVYRVFAGVGYPYGNSVALPFEKKYFSGGANSIRAWHVRSLGPGSLYEEYSDYPNQSADIKLEANMEYRFDLFWLLKGALFLDVGNIWEIKESEGRELAYFKADKILDDLAIGSGLGFRFDFSFFIFRFDVGLKLRNPRGISDHEFDVKWIPTNRPFDSEDIVYNIGIGYPF